VTKVSIDSIKVAGRIRKEITKIDELAEDIKRNGLLNPVTVMTVDGGYQLLAGLRRLKSAQMLGWTEIAVSVVSPADAEAALMIEISENEQREPFTYSEKMDYAKLFEDIEQMKAKERMLAGKSLESSTPMDGRPQGNSTSRDAIGSKIGMSGRQYERAKYIADNAPEETIEQLDRGESSINKAYTELRAKETTDTKPDPESLLSKKEKEALRKNSEFRAMQPEQKIEELQRQLKTERARAATAESELAREKELHHNSRLHKDSIIDNLKGQVENLNKLLEDAEAKIADLESKLNLTGELAS